MPLTGLTILAVDDNVVHNYAVAHMLEHAGGQVLRAYTGTEALAHAAKKPDVILLDVNLPDLNGFEVCRRVKSDPNTSDAVVIFLSATCHTTAAQEMAESVGAKAFLFYPIEYEQLIAVIRGQAANAR